MREKQLRRRCNVLDKFKLGLYVHIYRYTMREDVKRMEKLKVAR